MSRDDVHGGNEGGAAVEAQSVWLRYKHTSTQPAAMVFSQHTAHGVCSHLARIGSLELCHAQAYGEGLHEGLAMTKAMLHVLNQVAMTDVRLFLPKGGSVALLLEWVLCMSQSCLCKSIHCGGNLASSAMSSMTRTCGVGALSSHAHMLPTHVCCTPAKQSCHGK